MTVSNSRDNQPSSLQDQLYFEYGDIGDLPDVMEVMARSFSITYGESWNDNQCRSMLTLPKTRLLLAKIDQKLSGFAISRAVAGEEEILMIAVDPAFQKTGVGTSLIQHITKRAVQDGITELFLEVRSNNPAQTLYQRLGFEKIGSRAAYYTGLNRTKYDANTYRKLLKY